MHRCLEVSEISSRIAGYLTKQDAFRYALTCKTFLGPGLDGVWHTIDSFEPLVRCLPEGIWKEETLPSLLGVEGDERTLLSLRRDLTSEDMARYLSFYAPRIRAFQFNPLCGSATLSIGSLHGMQLATGRQPGALSPLLKRFVWYRQFETSLMYGPEYSTQLATQMTLFLGGEVEGLSIEMSLNDPPSYATAVHSGITRCETTLTTLSILGAEFIASTFRSFAFHALETLIVRFPSLDVLPYLAALPRLHRLKIDSPQGLDDGDRSYGAPVRNNTSNFPSLWFLEVAGVKLDFSRHLFQYLPTNKGVRSLVWDAEGKGGQVADWRSLLETLQEFSECFNLQRLDLQSSRYRFPAIPGSFVIPEGPEPVEMDPRQIDLEPLFTFNSLQTLSIEVEHNVLLTPATLAKIPIAWPQLRSLFLAPLTSNSHPPAISHNDVVELSQKLPGLRYLGVKFDASCVTGEERFVGSRPQLRCLTVGRSPICSPSGVAAFVEHNFPELSIFSTSWGAFRQDDEDVFKARWEATGKKWREARGLESEHGSPTQTE